MESLPFGVIVIAVSNHGGRLLPISFLLLGSAMVAFIVTPLWCNEELFVVLIMMVSNLAQAAAEAAHDTKSTASPDVSWFPLQVPSPARKLYLCCGLCDMFVPCLDPFSSKFSTQKNQRILFCLYSVVSIC